MIRVYHHIWDFGEGLSIAQEQKERLFNNIKDEFTYHPNFAQQHENEYYTFLKMINDIPNFDNNDYILYIHTKGASGNTQIRRQWREYMELSLIDDYKSHLKALDLKFDTSGVLMGIPYWSENIYGGNFWWTTVKFLNLIPKNFTQLIDIQNRHHAESLFLQLVNGWNPHNIRCFGEKYRHLYEFYFFMINDMLNNLNKNVKF
jgi:hypothetical protein